MTRRSAAFILAVVLVPTSAPGQASSNRFVKVMEDLFKKHRPAYQELRGADFNVFCQSNGLDEKDRDNQDRYLKIRFFHEMFTGRGASDCVGGGMLRIPYFWHWVKPNPRHEIEKLAEEKPLVEIRPPRRFARYKSFADIDRVPSLFLADLVSEKPSYRHPECGEFYTFGWCSEREMSFVLLLSLFGYQGKITQAGNHVTSFFLASFKKKDKTPLVLIAEVDNTFGGIVWSLAPDVKLRDWLRDLSGSGYANRMSRSAREKRRVRRIVVGAQAAARLDRLIQQYLNAGG